MTNDYKANDNLTTKVPIPAEQTALTDEMTGKQPLQALSSCERAFFMHQTTKQYLNSFLSVFKCSAKRMRKKQTTDFTDRHRFEAEKICEICEICG